MMKIIKKNQLTLLVLALMLVTAGYLNYNSNQNIQTSTQIASLGDATLVSSNAISNNEEIENNIVDNKENNSIIENNELVENSAENSLNFKNNSESSSVATNAGVKNDKFQQDYSSLKLEREKMYSQMLEANQKILDSSNTSDGQKESAQKEINSINNTKKAIMIAENLIKTKGFEDCIVYSNENSINVLIKKDELTKEDTAQIQSIIAREMKAKISNIHIMTK